MATETDKDALIAELVEALRDSKEKLRIECLGCREYKGGVPWQILLPKIDSLISTAAKMGYGGKV